MGVRLLLGCELDREVAGALPDARRASQRARAVALQRRTLVHEGSRHVELVRHQLVVVLRVGDRGVQKLQDVVRRGALRVHQDRPRLVHALATDVVDHEARLARRAAHVLGLRLDGHVGRGVAAPAAGAARRAARGRLAAAAARGRLRALLLVLGLGLALDLGLLGLGLLGGVLLLDLLGRLGLGLCLRLVLLGARAARVGLRVLLGAYLGRVGVRLLAARAIQLLLCRRGVGLPV